MDLKGKVAGLPKWAWAVIIAGGVIGGYYLYSRSKASSEESEVEGATGEASPMSPEYAPGTSALNQYAETEAGGGLQALGVPGPQPVATTPIAEPYLPSGVEGTISSGNELSSHLAEGILAEQQAMIEGRNQFQPGEQKPPVVNVNIGKRAAMGKEPTRKPQNKPNHKAPARRHGKKEKRHA